VHEVSLVAELVEAVERHADGRPVRAVRVLHATTIPDDVLRQAWDMLVDGRPLAGAVLEAEPFDIRLRCRCGYDGPLGHDDLVGASLAVCPSCGEASPVPPTPELELLEVALDG
jgi:hydrogenase nickel incorporation protein HypA/HybF